MKMMAALLKSYGVLYMWPGYTSIDKLVSTLDIKLSRYPTCSSMHSYPQISKHRRQNN